MTPEDAALLERARELEAEVARLRRQNEFLLVAATFFAHDTGTTT